MKLSFNTNRTLFQKADPKALPSVGQPTKYEELRLEILRENLRQATESFNMALLIFKVALVATTASAIASLAGTGLLLAGKISEGAFTSCMGAVSGTCFYQLSKDAQDRLEKANKRLSEVSEELESEN